MGFMCLTLLLEVYWDAAHLEVPLGGCSECIASVEHPPLRVLLAQHVQGTI